MASLWLLLLACRTAADTGPTGDTEPSDAETQQTDTATDTDTEPTETDDTETDDTEPTETDDTEPEVDPNDQDGDGSPVDEDCDDTDASVYPGAEETWDDVDEDCDGRIDGDGDYAGTLSLGASAVYEGTRYSWTLSCPMTLTREGGKLDFLATCTPDADDEYALLLLGEEITITPRRTTIVGPTFDRTVETTSTTWDSSSGELSLTWTDFENVSAVYVLDGFSLDMSGSAALTWQGT